MALDWTQLIEERNVWVAHNFPDRGGKRTPLDSVLGVIEECGELTHCHLKQVQAIRGTDEEHEAGAQDAIGDLTVYLLGVLNYIGKDECRPDMFELSVADSADSDRILLALSVFVGTLSDRMLSLKHPRDLNAACSYIVLQCRRYCRSRDWDYEEIVQATWDEVKQRDWQRWPRTGLPPVETANAE